MPDNTESYQIQENVAGLLCYLPFWVGFIASIIFLIIDKRKFVRFHAIQSLAMAIVLAIFFGVFSWAFWFIIWLFFIAAFVIWIILMVKAYQHEMFKLPIIGEFADRYSST